MNQHVPVLRDQVVDQLVRHRDGCYVDATFGRGGHARALLEGLGAAARLHVLDRDPEAIAVARELARHDPRLVVHAERFGRLGALLGALGLQGRVDGLLLDLGVSSPQLDDPARGFSFARSGPLDMRMDPGAGQSAAEWLATAGERDIAGVLRRLGEEPAARRIAAAIVRERSNGPIETTAQLAQIIGGVVPRRPGAVHPATRSFQAIRIFINDELGELEHALAASLDALAPGGRIAVISFHSLEDRIVKRFLRDQSRIDPALADLPVVPAAARPRLALPVAPIRPGAAEIEANPRARSATLRIGERR